jgi:thermitase
MRRSLMVLLWLVLGSSMVGASEHVPGELIVRFSDRAPDPAALRTKVLRTLESRLGADALLGSRKLKTDQGLSVIRLRRDAQLQQALSILTTTAGVEFAEPNYIVRLVEDRPLASSAGLPNDPDLSKNWGLSKINIAPLWNEGVLGNQKIVVAVIDTGIDWTHPDLAANLWTNPKETAGNGKDDDGNGFVDDIHGWNFATKTADSNDDQGHGTHCAGVIGGVGNNGVGIAGVNWAVSLMPIKFLTASGSGTIEDGVEAINYARIMRVQVMSNSWGFNGTSQALKEAIQKASDAGILFVAAAGNDSHDNELTPTLPGSYPIASVLSVAATDSDDRLASFSNWGRKSVHVAAPGVKIYSTYKGSAYKELSGTSMATPFVAGIAALLLSEHPEWDFAELKRRLIVTSDPVAGLRTKVAAHGRVNAYNAFHGIVTATPDPDESAWENVTQVVESAHPYKDLENSTFNVSFPGAKFIRVHFDKVETEKNYDKVSVESPQGDIVDVLTGVMTDKTSEFVLGDNLVIRLKSDSSNSQYGFHIDRIQVVR